MQVYGKDGKPIEVPDDQAAAGIAAGQYGLPAGQRVHVVTKDGRLGSVPAEDAASALQGGARIASQQELQKARDEEKYGGALGQATAAVGGALSGASAGITDDLAASLGPEGTREWLEGSYRTNPNLTTGAKVAGMLGGALVGDEEGLLGSVGHEAAEGAEGASLLGRAGEAASTVGKAVSAPTRAISGVGHAIEGAVGRALGVGEDGTLISRLAKGAVSKGAGFAAEGAAYGLADQVNEDALGDHELNAEKLYASGVHGALLGLAGGVGLSAAGELGSELLGRVAPKLGGMAEEQAVRAIEPHTAGARELARLPGGAKAAGRVLLDDGIVRPGDTLEDIAPRLRAARSKAGEEVGAVYKAADEAGLEGVSVKGLTDKLQAKLDELEKLPNMNAPAIRELRGAIEDIHASSGIPDVETAAANGIDRGAVLEHARMSFQQAQALKTRIGDGINWKTAAFPGAENVANEVRKDIYGELGRAIQADGESAARKLGGSFADELKEANRRYQVYSTLDRIAQNSTRLAEGRNIAAPSTKAAGLAAFMGMVAHGAGGPATVAASAGAAAANHLWKTRGASTSAVLLDKLAALRGVERAAKRVDREVDRGIAGILREPGRAAPTLREAPEGPYRTHAEAAISAAGNVAAHRARIAEAAAPLAMHAPNTARGFQSTGVRAAQYLAKTAPHRTQVQTLTPHLDEPRVSRADEQSYMLAVRAVHDPVTVLDDMSKGRATKAQVDAIREVYPKLYGEIVEKLRDRLADRSEPVPYEQRKQLALLFGPLAGPEFDPAFQARMQADFAAPAGPPASPSPKRGGSAPKRKLDMTGNVKLAGG